MVNQIQVFSRMLWRDFFVIKNRLLNLFINNSLIYPLTFLISFGYVQGHAYFGHDSNAIANVAIGPVLIIIVSLTFNFTHHIIFDLEYNRHIDYQLLFLSPRWLIVEKIVFSTLITTALVLPYFVSLYVIFPNQQLFAQQAPVSLVLIILMSTFMSSAYSQCASTIMRSWQIDIFWIRINHILISFGGFWVPLAIMDSFPLLGSCMRLNPFIYVTEGIKHAVTHNPEFLPVSFCIGVLFLFALVFMAGGMIMIQRRLDHI